MDVVRINPSSWVIDSAADVITGFSSKVWTERFQDPCEFEFRSSNVDYMRKMIPEGTWISLRDSQEVMRVETHNVTEDDTGAEEVVIKGRSVEQLFDDRATVVVQNDTGGQDNMWTYGSDDVWPTDAAKALIMNHVTVSTQEPNQKVPNTAVENLISNHVGEQMSYEHEANELASEIADLLRMEGAGIRGQLSGDGRLMIYIYRGVNRSVNQTTRPAVVMRTDAKHVVNPNYLFTIKDYKNVAYVVGTAWQQVVYAPGVSSSISGLERRILLVSADDIKAGSTTAKKRRQAKAKGLAALAKHNQKTFFDGEASIKAPYTRGIDYNLGDEVTLMGKYGISQSMLVSEYVRTEDGEGERSFPTLVMPQDVFNLE